MGAEIPFSPQAQVILNGTKILKSIGFSFSNRINTIPYGSINLGNMKGLNSILISDGDEIEIQMGWDLGGLKTMFHGIVSVQDIPINSSGSQLRIPMYGPPEVWEKELTADDNMDPYDNQEAYIKDIIEYLNAQVSRPVEMAVSQSTEDEIITYGFDEGNSTLQVVQELVDIGGYEFFYSFFGGKLILRPPPELDSEDIVKTLILGDENLYGSLPNDNIAKMISDNVFLDASSVVNRIKVKSADIGSAIAYAEDSYQQLKFWRESVVQIDSIKTTNGLQLYANEYVRTHKFPLSSITLQTWGLTDVEPGTIVYIDDRLYGTKKLTSKILEVVEVLHEYGPTGWFTTLTLGEPKVNFTALLS